MSKEVATYETQIKGLLTYLSIKAVERTDKRKTKEWLSLQTIDHYCFGHFPFIDTT